MKYRDHNIDFISEQANYYNISFETVKQIFEMSDNLDEFNDRLYAYYKMIKSNLKKG